MITQSLNRLETLVQTIPHVLIKMEDVDFSFKPSPERWSKKEILGHLIDSASNNHHKFIRGQYEAEPTISYDQNKWNALSHYQSMDSYHIIQFWTMYNQHILHIIKQIPSENLQKKCRGSDGNYYTIEFLIIDYVVHLEHHLWQILKY